MSLPGIADQTIGRAWRHDPLGVPLEPGVEAALVQHARRGARVQGVLRLALAGFALAVVVTVPPARDRNA